MEDPRNYLKRGTTSRLYILLGLLLVVVILYRVFKFFILISLLIGILFILYKWKNNKYL
jgi:hypothetical protein